MPSCQPHQQARSQQHGVCSAVCNGGRAGSRLCSAADEQYKPQFCARRRPSRRQPGEGFREYPKQLLLVYHPYKDERPFYHDLLLLPSHHEDDLVLFSNGLLLDETLASCNHSPPSSSLCILLSPSLCTAVIPLCHSHFLITLLVLFTLSAGKGLQGRFIQHLRLHLEGVSLYSHEETPRASRGRGQG